MADEVDILLRFCEEQWTQCRQSETQRSTVTNFVITIAAATIAFIAHKGFAIVSLPLAVFLFILGLCGALTSAKLYERWQFHRNRAHYWYKRIDELKPDAQLLHLKKVADDAYGKKLQYVHLHWFWLTMHIFIALLGLICIIVIMKTCH